MSIGKSGKKNDFNQVNMEGIQVRVRDITTNDISILIRTISFVLEGLLIKQNHHYQKTCLKQSSEKTFQLNNDKLEELKKNLHFHMTRRCMIGRTGLNRTHRSEQNAQP